MYVYDDDRLSTRITQTHLLSPNNTPAGSIGIQVEVYASPYRLFPSNLEAISAKVVAEVLEMGLAEEIEAVHTHITPYPIILLYHPRMQRQNLILRWLQHYGLQREDDDLCPMIYWNRMIPAQPSRIQLAGRFVQWKYFRQTTTS
jgi:hypothetical protein